MQVPGGDGVQQLVEVVFDLVRRFNDDSAARDAERDLLRLNAAALIAALGSLIAGPLPHLRIVDSMAIS
jgi:hypothetical protein